MRGTYKNQESGFVAIIVTMVIMVVLVLITTGFMRIIGREQRQVLDRQLSSQAFYAAETGINNAAKALSDPTDPLLVDKTNCGTSSTPPLSTHFPPGSNIIDGNGGIEYSCLTIDRTPRSLEYSALNNEDTKIIRFNGLQNDGTTPSPVTRIRISWQAQSGESTFSSQYPQFPPSTGAGRWSASTPVIRATVTPVSSLTRTGLTNNTYTAFLYPNSVVAIGQAGAATYATGVGNQGDIVEGKCNVANDSGDTPRSCTVEINGLTSSSLLVTLRSIYSISLLKVTAHNGGVGESNAVRIGGAQWSVDSTGKAGDVLRRINVRIPSRDRYEMPSFALETAYDICKQYSIGPNSIMSLVGAATNCTP